MKTWNRERKRTRDRLLEYNFAIVPPHPHSGGIVLPYPEESNLISIGIPYLSNGTISSVYPWENTTLTMLSHQLYTIAVQNGYSGTEESFLASFGNASEKEVIVGLLENFPVPGNTTHLYLDRDTGILYYFKATDSPIMEAVAEQMGIVIAGTSDNLTYLYIPVRALPIENLIYDCGDAAEYID